MIISFVTSLIIFWTLLVCFLWFWKMSLFVSTWKEPYFKDSPVVIESDDWGPGGDFHSIRLEQVFNVLKSNKDSTGRNAVLTANIVLSVPDVDKINADNDKNYHRVLLNEHSPEIFNNMLRGMEEGIFVPQLHGLEHLNSEAFISLWHTNDRRLSSAHSTSNWWNWEELDSPLQGHYVNGANLPTCPISSEKSLKIIKTATDTFSNLFGFPSLTTVAPCYLWDDEIEVNWLKNNILFIQTAGYRCTGRDINGGYIQAPQVIRMGAKNTIDQTYLVRNVMYEPVDGNHTFNDAIEEAKIANKQALPISISTHRYNYTRSEQECHNALSGLDKLLKHISLNFTRVRFLSSPELASSLANKDQDIINNFNKQHWQKLSFLEGPHKITPYFSRLTSRHPKLLKISIISGLIAPIWLFLNFNEFVLNKK